MGLNVRDVRSGNIIYLITKKYANNQSSLARALGNKGYQRKLSNYMINEKKMPEAEARWIERDLVIPTGWMDIENGVRDGWELIMKYRKLTEEERVTVNSFSTFVLERLGVGES